MLRRLKHIGLGILFVLFTLLGLFIAAFEEGSDRLLGLAVVLFFGGGGAMYFFVLAQRGQPGRGPAIEHVTLDGRTQTAFVVRQDRRVILAVALGMLAMALGGALLVIPPLVGAEITEPPGEAIIGIVAFGVLGLMAIFFLIKALRGSSIALTSDGLWSIGPIGRIFVPWSSIGHLGLFEMHDNPMLGIAVTRPETVRIGPIERRFMNAQRSMFGADLAFPLRSLAVDPRQFVSAIVRYVDQPELRGRIGTAEELRELARSSSAAE